MAKKKTAPEMAENKPEEKTVKTACIRFNDVAVLVTLTLPDKIAEASVLK